MSKMSQLHMELSESASDLGFASIEDAEQAGYRADYNLGRMVYDTTKELNEAHEEWEKERYVVLKDLKDLHLALAEGGYTEWATIINDAIEFIEKGEV